MAFIQPDAGLGFDGFVTLVLLSLIDAWVLERLTQRILFPSLILNPQFLFWPSLAVIAFVSITLHLTHHGKVALIMLVHFCALALVLGLVFVGLNMGKPIFHDYSRGEMVLRQVLVQAFPDMKSVWVNVRAIPADLSLSDPTDAKSTFIWSYVLSLS